MAKPLTFLPEVAEDIASARDWYAERSVEAASRFITALEAELLLIEQRPQLGGFHDDRRLYRFRRLSKFPFVVVYREFDDQTLIVAVYHASRHPDYWKIQL